MRRETERSESTTSGMPRQHWRLQPCAAFIREATTGVYESDMGLWSPDAGRLLRYRRELNARNVAVFMNITPEFASSLGSRDLATTARSVRVSSLPDALLVSGPMAGAEPSVDAVRAAKLGAAR